jgi:putative endonuclease
MRGSSQKARPTSTSARGRAAERRVAWHYRLRGYKLLAQNVRAGGVELDLIVRRGRRVVFVEVKEKSGPRYGDPLEAVDERKRQRLRRGAEAWLVANPAFASLAVAFEVAAVRAHGIERVCDSLESSASCG